jgi:uncharacterized protein (TIGR00369 family)
MARAPKKEQTARDSAFVERRRAMGGLAFFRHMLEGQMPQAPMTKLLNMRLLEVDEGRVVFGARPTRDHYNGMGVVHGGLAATLLDSALGCAINSMAPPGKIFTTLELKINYTRPLTEEVGDVRCEARVIHLGSRTATAEGRIVDADGKLYAHGTTTCIVVDAGKKKPKT